MADIVLSINVEGVAGESQLVQAVDAFAMKRCEAGADGKVPEAPEIMIKAEHGGDFARKSVIFQDRKSAAEFLRIWRRLSRTNRLSYLKS